MICKFYLATGFANCMTWKRKKKEREWLSNACLFKRKHFFSVIIVHHKNYGDNLSHVCALPLENIVYPNVRNWKLAGITIRVTYAIYYRNQDVKCVENYARKNIFTLCDVIVQTGRLPGLTAARPCLSAAVLVDKDTHEQDGWWGNTFLCPSLNWPVRGSNTDRRKRLELLLNVQTCL